jgi:hypothetical protein
MGFVPSDANWFLAELVVEHRIEGVRPWAPTED